MASRVNRQQPRHSGRRTRYTHSSGREHFQQINMHSRIVNLDSLSEEPNNLLGLIMWMVLDPC